MKQKNNYFKMLSDLSKFTVRSADMLNRMLLEFDYEHTQAQMAEMHEIEHESDMFVHEIHTKLAAEFITPIDREDISELVSQIDDVVDSIEDISLSLFIYDIHYLKKEIFEFIDIISKSATALETMVLKLENFRKSKDIHHDIVKINELEDEADRIYTKSVHKLFTEESDQIKILKWNEIFKKLENCCDSFEEVAALVHNIIMKNS